MSYKLTGLVWDVTFPTQGQKLVMLRFADYASDEGESIFPANDVVAYQCGLSRRGVQYILSGFRNCGLLHLVHEGGKGAKDTNRYQINIELLVQLALREQMLEGAKDSLAVVEPTEEFKGAPCAPYVLQRVHRAASRVHSETDKGEPRFTRLTINHQLEQSNARGARAEGPRAPRAEKAKTLIFLESGDSAFGAWLDRMAEHNRDDLVTAARDTGTIKVHARWPPPEGLQGLVSAGSIDIASRKVGGDA